MPKCLLNPEKVCPRRTKDSIIHDIVHAVKALNRAEAIVNNAKVTDHIRNARDLCWKAGDELGVDIADQLKALETTN